jgi:hypothetical protein
LATSSSRAARFAHRKGGAPVGALDAEERAVVADLAHALHHEPIVLARPGAEVVRLVDELQMVEAEQAQSEKLHGDPLDADTRHWRQGLEIGLIF